MLKKISSFNLNSLRQSKIVAGIIAKHVSPGDCIALQGDLGAGKTTMASFLIKDLIKDTKVTVTSPTFTIINTYYGNGFEVWHCDLYRINSVEEAEAIGLLDATYSDAVLIIEWPDIMAASLADTALFIGIDVVYGQNIQRTLTLSCRDPDSKWCCLARNQDMDGLI